MINLQKYFFDRFKIGDVATLEDIWMKGKFCASDSPLTKDETLETGEIFLYKKLFDPDIFSIGEVFSPLTSALVLGSSYVPSEIEKEQGFAVKLLVVGHDQILWLHLNWPRIFHI